MKKSPSSCGEEPEKLTIFVSFALSSIVIVLGNFLQKLLKLGTCDILIFEISYENVHLYLITLSTRNEFKSKKSHKSSRSTKIPVVTLARTNKKSKMVLAAESLKLFPSTDTRPRQS